MGEMSLLYKLRIYSRKRRYNRFRKIDERNRKLQMASNDIRNLKPIKMPDNLNEMSGIQQENSERVEEIDRASEILKYSTRIAAI